MDKEMEAQRKMTITTQCRAVLPVVVLFSRRILSRETSGLGYKYPNCHHN